LELAAMQYDRSARVVASEEIKVINYCRHEHS